MSEESIIQRLAEWLDGRKFPFRIPRAFIYRWESDYWCMTNEVETREFEIKISRSDYLIDKHKEKHSDHSKGANYFYYVCPAGLISKEEVPAKYGLIYIRDPKESSCKIEMIKKPVRLNPNKFGQWKMLANKMYWKWYSLWYAKYITEEITFDVYKEGFNIQLTESESEGVNNG